MTGISRQTRALNGVGLKQESIHDRPTRRTRGEAIDSPRSLTTEVVRELAGLSGLRDTWEAMSLDVNSDIEFYTTIVLSRGNRQDPHTEARELSGAVLRPHVIAVKRNGEVRSILAGRLELKHLDVALGYKTLYLPAVRCLTLIHGGLMGEESEECGAALLESIRMSLRDGEADTVWFYGLNIDSSFHRAAREAGGIFTRDHFPKPLQRWSVQLPSSYEDLYRGLSRTTRRHLKQHSQHLCEAFADSLTIKRYKSLHDLEWVLEDIEAVAARTYQRGLNVGFICNRETREWMSLAARRGWLEAHLLYIDGKPCAFWNGLLYKRTLFLSSTGYDPRFGMYSPGSYLLQRLLQDICSEKSADKVDFGFGNARYKQEWGTEEQAQSSFFLFAPTLKGASFSCLRTPMTALANGLRAFASASGLAEGLKRAWRHRIVQERTGGD